MVEKIAELKKKIATLQEEIDPLQDELDYIKAKCLTEVVEEKSGPRLKYPDRETRAAAVKVKMFQDPRAKELEKKLKGYNKQKVGLEIELEQLESQKDALLYGIVEEEEEGDV